MKSICFFCSYYNEEEIPYYVKFYLEELMKHFGEIIFITNEKKLSPSDEAFLAALTIQPMLVKNEGYDFGMWYKAIRKYDVSGYDRIGLVNDSCILFRSLDGFFSWLDRESPDYSGMTDCDLHSYHVQSYFMIFHGKAIHYLKSYFEQNGLLTDLQQVIKIYEIGLSTYLVNAGVNVKAYFSFKDSGTIGNPSWMQAKNMIKKGFPLVKKRIVARNYGESDYKGLVAVGFDPYPSHYIKLIKKVTGSNKIDAIFSGMQTGKGFWGELKFQATCIIAKIYGTMLRYRLTYVMVRIPAWTYSALKKSGKVK